MPESSKKFLFPEAISKIRGLEFKARLIVEGFITGLHKSPYHGFSVEFAEHRPYMTGDSVKNLDWKIFAKRDRYFVKEFEEETNLKAYLLLDCSASMGYSSQKISKFEYASYLAAALAYLLIRQKDAAGLVTYDQAIKSYLPPSSKRVHLGPLLTTLENTKPSSKTKTAPTLHQMAERIKRRGLVILLSDLLDNPDEVLFGLKHFRHKGHEVIVFHILDPMERTFAFHKEAIFEDLETGEKINTLPWQVRRDYQKAVEAFSHHYLSECRKNLIDYQLLDTAMPFDRALFGYIAKRERLF